MNRRMNRRMNKFGVIATVFVLVVCLVIVTGSTFSLFTSKSNNDIAINSGKLELAAKLDALKLYSKDVEQTDKFANGGTANFNDAKTELTLKNVTPGDKVTLNIVLTNNSNVDLQYRINWAVTGELADALTAKVGNADITSGTSEWTLWTAPATDAEKTQTLTLSIELPLDADDTWQNKEAKISFTVEAVQANGTGEYSSVAFVNTAAGLQAAIDSGATEITLNDDITLDGALVIGESAGNNTRRAARRFADNDTEESESIVINLNGKTLTSKVAEGAAIVNNADVVITNGTVVAENGVAFENNATATLEEVTISGAVASKGADATLTLNESTVTVEDAETPAISATEGGTVVVNGGTYTNTEDNGVVVSGNVTITDGSFNGKVEAGEGENNAPVISGGNFDCDVSDYIDNEDTVIFENDDGRKDVIKGVAYDETTNTYSISTADGLGWVAKYVNQYSDYSRPFDGATVVLTCDINLGGIEWTPIGDYRFSANRFCGTFDGQGHTVSNFKITKRTDKNDDKKSSYGFFGNMEGTVKNLTIDNATVSSYAYVGALVGRMTNGVLENCHVTNTTVACSYWQAGGMIGQLNDNCKVVDCSITGSTVTGASAIGGLVGPITATNAGDGTVKELIFENCLVKDCTVVQDGSFGANYDKLFGAMFGDIDVSDNTMVITNCVAENTTVKDNATNALYNTISGSNITIDGNKLIANGLCKADGSNTYYVYSAAGLAALNAKMADKSAGQGTIVNIMSDIDFADYTWETVDSHADSSFYLTELNGNGHTISNLTVSGQAMFSRFAGFGDVTITNITFDGAKVSTASINTALFVGQTYQNLLLDNVDVKNSTITGGYKVAALIGTVYNENTTSITATLKNCNVDNCVVTSVTYDFMTCGLVAFVYVDDNDNVAFENTTISNTTICNTNSAGYSLHAFLYYTSAPVDDCFNEAEGVTVTNCKFDLQ